MRNLDKYRYEYASHRVEELLPLVTEDMPATHPLAMELAIMSDVIIAYGRPTTAQIIQMSLEENGLSQKDLAQKIGVSPSRVNDYVTGRAEPTLRVARLLCATLGIAPALLLGM